MINSVTVKNFYPILQTDECLDMLGELHILGASGSNFENWKAEIDEQDKKKTTFSMQHGLYKFLRIPVGLKNGLSTFQHAMEILLLNVRWQQALVYLDKFIISLRSIEEDLDPLQTVLGLLSREGVSLRLRKWLFF